MQIRRSNWSNSSSSSAFEYTEEYRDALYKIKYHLELLISLGRGPANFGDNTSKDYSGTLGQIHTAASEVPPLQSLMDEESLFSESCTENGKHADQDFIDFTCVDNTNMRLKDKKPIKIEEIKSLKRKSDRSLEKFWNKDIENAIALEDPEKHPPQKLLPFSLLHSTSTSSAQQFTYVSGLNMVPPHNNMAFGISSSPPRIYSSPMYGVLPTYPHLPSSSVVPVPDSMSYGALLKQVMNPGYFSHIVGSSSVKNNGQQH